MHSSFGGSHQSHERPVQENLPQIRHFSSSPQRAGQELFTEIERPLTKKAKKALNKESQTKAPQFWSTLDEQLTALVKVDTVFYLVAAIANSISRAIGPQSPESRREKSSLNSFGPSCDPNSEHVTT